MDSFHTLFVDRIKYQLSHCAHQRLKEAILYMIENPGKYFRAQCVEGTSQWMDGDPDASFDAACAIECMHLYTLIHDDLPVMDNDLLRRGQPACHVAFDEPTALLAGNALNTMAFEMVAENKSIPKSSVIKMIQVLARSAGSEGVLSGQMMDLFQDEPLETVYHYKTSSLMKASIHLGSLTANRSDPAWLRFGETLGLAFQLKDDLMDSGEDNGFMHHGIVQTTQRFFLRGR